MVRIGLYCGFSSRAPEMPFRDPSIPLVEEGFERQRRVRLGGGMLSSPRAFIAAARARGIASRGGSTAASKEKPSDSGTTARPTYASA